MRYLLALLCLAIIISSAQAQPINRFNYQGIARDANGLPLNSKILGLRLTIHDGAASGTVVYRETQAPTTNAYGLYAIAIGNGTVVTGSMSSIKWTTDKYLQVEIDPNGGSNYVDAGTTQLLSVPYALYADKFHIPYADSTTDTSTLFLLHNSGRGTVLQGINTSTADTIFAIRGILSDTASKRNAAAIQGISNGKGLALQGINTSPADSAYTIQGILSNTASKNTAAAIQGISNGKGLAIQGINTSSADSTLAIQGVVTGTGRGLTAIQGVNNGKGSGVFGINTTNTLLGSALDTIQGVLGMIYGSWGASVGPNGNAHTPAAVRGVIVCDNNLVGSGRNMAAVHGYTNGEGRGVLGVSTHGSGVVGVNLSYNGRVGGSAGVSGTSLEDHGVGVRATHSVGGTAFEAISNSGVAALIYNQTINSTAPAAIIRNNGNGFGTEITSRSAEAVYATMSLTSLPRISIPLAAIYGQSGSEQGVSGASNANNGVYGFSNGNSYAGIKGSSTSTTGYGVWGTNTGGGLAGYFQGDVTITGNLSKGSGTFKIDHPSDPENKYLYHSFIESPDMMNVYNGNITTNSNGDAEVTLPAYFSDLNRDVRYQLTVIGTFAQAIVSEEVHGNIFSIKTDKPNVKVSWLVTGIRKDPYANAHRVMDEVEKEDVNKGKYLHPAEYGKPMNKGIGTDLATN